MPSTRTAKSMSERLKGLDPQQQEAARMVAQGSLWKGENEVWADVGERYGISPEVLNLWRKDDAVKAKIEQCRYAMNLAGGKGVNAKDAARRILETHSVVAAEKLVTIMATGSIKQQYDAAVKILDGTGVFMGEKSAQFVIQISGQDVKEMLAGAVELGLAEQVESVEALYNKLPESAQQPKEEVPA